MTAEVDVAMSVEARLDRQEGRLDRLEDMVRLLAHSVRTATFGQNGYPRLDELCNEISAERRAREETAPTDAVEVA